MRISDWSSDVCSSDLLQDEAYNAQQALFNLRTENDALKASLDGAAEIPATIGAAFNEAATAYARIGGLNVSLRESINNNLYGAIEQAHGAFTTFWEDRKSTRLNSSH